VVLPEAMRVMGDYTFVLYGLVVIIVIIVMPKGIVGGLETLSLLLLSEIRERRLWTFWKSKA